MPVDNNWDKSKPVQSTRFLQEFHKLKIVGGKGCKLFSNKKITTCCMVGSEYMHTKELFLS